LAPEQREALQDDRAFIERVCLPFLLNSQNSDGGWGFQPNSHSRVEPSTWALLALASCNSSDGHREASDRGLNFLKTSQLPDGSWASSPEAQQGSWVTSLACWALLGRAEFSENVRRGLSWLCAEQPGEAQLWWRVIRTLRGTRRVSAQSDSYYGWSWTHGTASWVEPTSFAVIVLGSEPTRRLPAAARRTKLATAMLCDRMCPGGGWNCGNPMVYGVAGEPQVGTTAWALLALRHDPERAENQQGLQWLEQAWPGIKSPASLAMASLALETYGRDTTQLRMNLRAQLESGEAPLNIPTAAWGALALAGNQLWLPSPAKP
jgi:hypothetical protein